MNKIPVQAWINLPHAEYSVPSWAMGCLTKFTSDKKLFYDTIPKANTLG